MRGCVENVLQVQGCKGLLYLVSPARAKAVARLLRSSSARSIASSWGRGGGVLVCVCVLRGGGSGGEGERDEGGRGGVRGRLCVRVCV